MIALLIVGLSWLGLLTFVVGVLHVCTSTPTPRPDTAPAFTLIGHEPEAATRYSPSNKSPSRSVPTIEAA
jgi:hypothetical protein